MSGSDAGPAHAHRVKGGLRGGVRCELEPRGGGGAAEPARSVGRPIGGVDARLAEVEARRAGGGRRVNGGGEDRDELLLGEGGGDASPGEQLPDPSRRRSQLQRTERLLD